jgi:hypothetical protein
LAQKFSHAGIPLSYFLFGRTSMFIAAGPRQALSLKHEGAERIANCPFLITARKTGLQTHNFSEQFRMRPVRPFDDHQENETGQNRSPRPP